MNPNKPLLRFTMLLIAFSLSFMAFATNAQAATGKRIALVIGNDAYQHVTKLQKAGNDAVAMARELKAAGFEVLLHRDLNYQRMVKAVETLSGSITGGDQVVVFFAGHGVQLKTGSYLLPVDIEASSESEVEKFAYSLTDLTDKLSEAKASFTLVMVDACRDNPLRSKGRSIGTTRGLSAIEPPKGQMVVFSASKGQQALDRLSDNDTNPNGVFTREFIAKMKRPGVRIEDLVREVQDSVEALARTVSHDQRPAIYNEARGNFYFFGPTSVQVAPSAPVAPEMTANQREDAFWNDAKAASNREAFEAYLGSYPKGRYASLARANVARLSAASVTPASPAVNTAQPQPQAATTQASMNPGKVFKDCPECPELVVIPAGSFQMGSSAAEQALANAAGVPATVTSRESPQHSVNIKSFAAGKYAVTKGEFANFVRAKGYKTEAEKGDGCNGWPEKYKDWRNVGFTQTNEHPVVCVTWNDAQAYAQWISQISGKSYRLLSEGEREYATRGGTQTAFWWGDSINTSQANYYGSYNASPKGEYRQATVPVSSFSPNPFGLYNVHGNVSEWVEDCFHDTYSEAPTDGRAWITGCSVDARVFRGLFSSGPAELRSAFRQAKVPFQSLNSVGFRLARTL